jgi:hypothetical protein
MSTIRISESGMDFGPFPADSCFWIEKSTYYQSIKKDIKIAEFILVKRKNEHDRVFWIVEAKNSSPRPGTLPDFDEYISEIRDKITNTFLLSTAIALGRHGNTEPELPREFSSINFDSIAYRLVLVINGHQEDWLAPIKDALSVALKPLLKTWAITEPAVAVLNEKMACEYGLIQH